MIQSFIPTHYIYLIGIYLTYVSFPLKLTKVACLIQGVWYKMLYHHTMVIKERLCRTTLSWRHIIGMWDTKNQYKRDSNAIRLFRIISIPSKFCYFRLPDHVIFDGYASTRLPVSMYTTKTSIDMTLCAVLTFDPQLKKILKFAV